MRTWSIYAISHLVCTLCIFLFYVFYVPIWHVFIERTAFLIIEITISISSLWLFTSPFHVPFTSLVAVSFAWFELSTAKRLGGSNRDLRPRIRLTFSRGVSDRSVSRLDRFQKNPPVHAVCPVKNYPWSLTLSDRLRGIDISRVLYTRRIYAWTYLDSILIATLIAE